MTDAAEPPVAPGTAIRRHALATRIWHWINAVALLILIGSGIGIFKAHPRLYWGIFGANADHPWTQLNDWPQWAVSLVNLLTIPTRYNLALSRRWHLFFALVLGFGLLAYMVAGLINRHLQRDLRVRAKELAPHALVEDAKAPLNFRFHDPERPAAYNIFQKLSYVGIVFVVLPLVILTGLTMSPGMNAAWPWLTDLFGGRQSARSIHFLCMVALSLFTVVHLTLVILAGTVNEVRSMLTGWWRVPE